MYTAYQFQCIAPMLLFFLVGGVACWFSGNS